MMGVKKQKEQGEVLGEIYLLKKLRINKSSANDYFKEILPLKVRIHGLLSTDKDGTAFPLTSLFVE